jgi:hypothetical protein
MQIILCASHFSQRASSGTGITLTRPGVVQVVSGLGSH